MGWLLDAAKKASAEAHVKPASTPTPVEERVSPPVAPEKPVAATVMVRMCGACGGSDFWQRLTGEWVCQRCHPDPRTLGQGAP